MGREIAKKRKSSPKGDARKTVHAATLYIYVAVRVARVGHPVCVQQPRAYAVVAYKPAGRNTACTQRRWRQGITSEMKNFCSRKRQVHNAARGRSCVGPHGSRRAGAPRLIGRQRKASRTARRGTERATLHTARSQEYTAALGKQRIHIGVAGRRSACAALTEPRPQSRARRQLQSHH